MFLASKTALAGIVLMLLTTGISAPRPTPLASGANLSQEVPAVRPGSDVGQIEKSLRDKGHYRGKVEAVVGPRTQTSIRGVQNLSVTGPLDTQTAVQLGITLESHKDTGNETTKGKPSAGIKWAKGSRRTSKSLGKAVKAQGGGNQ